jgi:TolA-binding protein
VVAKAPEKTHLRPFALVVLADAHLKLGKPEQAAGTIERLLKDYPDLPTKDEMLLKLADARLALKEHGAAREVYAQIGPRSAFRDRAELGRARALFGLKKYAEAEKACRDLLKRFKETAANKALRIPEQCHYIIGLACFHRAQYAPAAKAFSRLLTRVQQGPMAEDAAYRLCWCYYRLGDPQAEKLVAACVAFRRRFPASEWTGRVEFLTAEGCLRLGKFAEAVVHYKKIGPKDPNYADALYRIAYAYHRLKKPDEAARAYDVFARKFGSHQKTAAALAAAAGLYQAAGKYAEAVERYDRYLKAYPKGPDAEEVSYQRGICYARQSAFDKMAAAFQQYTARYPKGRYAGIAFYWLGRHHRIRGDAAAENGKADDAIREYALAEKAFRQSVERKGPRRDEALLAAAECAYNRGRRQADRAAVLSARAKGAEGAEKTRLQKQAADLEAEADASLRRAAQGFLDLVRRSPERIKLESIYFWTAGYFREHDDPKAAIQVLRTLLDRFEKSKRIPAALYELALLHGELKPPDHKGVITWSDRLLERKPKEDLALQTTFSKANALYALKKYREAEPLYAAVSRRGAGLPKVASVVKLGHICYARKEYAAAARYFAEVGLLYHDEQLTPEALYFAGKANVLLKDVEAGIKLWQQLVGRFETSDWAARAKGELPGLGYTVAADGSIRKKP